jgi:hypothetical protein
MKIIFATVSSSAQFSEVLTLAGAGNRLLSFYELQNRENPKAFLESFVLTGLNPKRKTNRKRKWNYSVPQYSKFRVMALLDRLADYETNPRDEDEEHVDYEENRSDEQA